MTTCARPWADGVTAAALAAGQLGQFYALVLRKSTGLMAETPVEKVIDEVRRRYPREAETLVAELTEIGRRIGQSNAP